MFHRSRTLPVVQQGEIGECGLACLAMISAYYGGHVSLAALRRRHPVSAHGATLKQIMTVASELALDTRAVRAELEYLPRLKLPCILHWEMKHFVVLKNVGRTHVTIHDPALGEVRLPLGEVDRRFTGVALELSPLASFRTERPRRELSIRRLLASVDGLRVPALQLIGLALGLEILNLAAPLAVQWALDEVLTAANYSLLTLLGVAFLALAVFQAITHGMRGWVAAGVGTAIAAQWTKRLFAHVVRLPVGTLERRSIGDVMSRFVSLQLMQQSISGNLIETLLDGLFVVLVLGVMLHYSPTLTAIAAAGAALYAIARLAAHRRLRRIGHERMQHAARQHGQIIESLHGATSLKLAGAEPLREAQVTNSICSVANCEVRLQRTNAVFSAFAHFVSASQRVLLIWVGTYMALAGTLTAGMLVVFIAYAEMLAMRSAALIDRISELRLLEVHADRVADLVLDEQESSLVTGYAASVDASHIRLDNVSFRYSPDSPWILRNCTFELKMGDSIAIVGPSGCGKSTLAKLLLGLLEPTEGCILVDGVDVRRIGLRRYRGYFGAVMQDDRLFAGSIADNIGFFDSRASMTAIEAASRLAHLHDDVRTMPLGYETLVGDMGSALSGGQRQRLLLARALYRAPRYLVLDEATSQLDVALERAINEMVGSLAAARIVIAHRPETIASTRRVVELRGGRLIETTCEDYLDLSLQTPVRMAACTQAPGEVIA